jgi:hypothetical protein
MAAATDTIAVGERRRSALRAMGREALPDKSRSHDRRGDDLRGVQRADAAAHLSSLPRDDADGGAHPRRPGHIDQRNPGRLRLHQPRPLRPAVFGCLKRRSGPHPNSEGPKIDSHREGAPQMAISGISVILVKRSRQRSGASVRLIQTCLRFLYYRFAFRIAPPQAPRVT